MRYRLPGGPLAALAERALVRPRLEEIFDYRRARLLELLEGIGRGGRWVSSDAERA